MRNLALSTVWSPWKRPKSCKESAQMLLVTVEKSWIHMVRILLFELNLISLALGCIWECNLTALSTLAYTVF